MLPTARETQPINALQARMPPYHRLDRRQNMLRSANKKVRATWSMQASKRLIRKEEKPHNQSKCIKCNVQEGEEACLSSPSPKKRHQNMPLIGHAPVVRFESGPWAETKKDAWDG